jgi:hypothetical protein
MTITNILFSPPLVGGWGVKNIKKELCIKLYIKPLYRALCKALVCKATVYKATIYRATVRWATVYKATVYRATIYKGIGRTLYRVLYKALVKL